MPLDSGERLGAPNGETAARAALSPIKQRILRPTDPEGKQELGFMLSSLCQTSLPYRQPKPDVRHWESINGDTLLRVDAGVVYSPELKRTVSVPLPAGPKARLVLIHLHAEAKRQKSAVISVDQSMSKFAKSVLGWEPGGRDIRTLKEQLTSIAASRWMVISAIESGRPDHEKLEIIKRFEMWNQNDERQQVLWPNTIEFSPEYWEMVKEHLVPLDMNHVRKLMHSAMALDIYMWLVERLHRVRSPFGDFVPWAHLHRQFGQGYARLNKFREVFRWALLQVAEVYVEAAVRDEIDRSGTPLGLRLCISPPPIPK